MSVVDRDNSLKRSAASCHVHAFVRGVFSPYPIGSRHNVACFRTAASWSNHHGRSKCARPLLNGCRLTGVLRASRRAPYKRHQYGGPSVESSRVRAGRSAMQDKANSAACMHWLCACIGSGKMKR
eukprot:1158758-Pelagomonas_calceolata.AAC.9